MGDSQSSSEKVINSSPCTSEILSLETQPPTSVQQVHSALQAPADHTQTCSCAPSKPCCGAEPGRGAEFSFAKTGDWRLSELQN